MMNWIKDRLKWLLLAAAVGGPVVAYLGWSEGERIRDVNARGVETVAAIDGANERTGRRGRKSYTVNLAWKDAAGVDRKAEDVSVSSSYAGKIIDGDTLIAGEARIKYLADDATAEPVLVEDVGDQEELDTFMFYGGIGAGGIGIIGSALFFLLGRRRREDEGAAT